MTYSIVARDPETGDLGVAVQTCMFAVGTIVPWARAGVGAVATQAFGEPAYGSRCLDALERGLTADDALAEARALDPGEALRQVGVVGADGRAAAFTGDLTVAERGHHVGDDYAVQANMMATATVWPAMADAYEAASGSFPERLLAALLAAQAEGGDARGEMSAAMRVVGQSKIDLRVDASESPLADLARLLRTADAFAHFERGTDALFTGDTKTGRSELEIARALLPDDENIKFAHAGALFFGGDTAAGTAEMRALVAHRPTWATVLRGFADVGFITLPPDTDLDALLRD